MFYSNSILKSCQSHQTTHEKKEHTKRETSARVVDNSKETFTEILPPHCDEKTSSGLASVNLCCRIFSAHIGPYVIEFHSHALLFKYVLKWLWSLILHMSCIVCYIKLLGNITQEKLLPFVSNPEVTWTSWPWPRTKQTKGHKSIDSLLLN